MDEGKPLDGIGIFQRALFCAFLIIAAGALSVLVLSLEKRSPVPQAAFVAAHTKLSHPLGFAASVRQCADPRPFDQGCDEPRFYMAKESK